MRTFESYPSLDAIPSDFGPCALTIGNFDGVHLGHQAILEQTRRRASEAEVKAVALTFDPHPAKVVAPERAPALMMPPAQRLERFARLGIDAGVVAAFTPQFSRQTPEEFVRAVLVERLQAAWIVVGEDFRFGRRGAGDVAVLRRLGESLGFGVDAAPPVRLGGKVVSSTRIRSALAAGCPQVARRLLGDCFRLQGAVVAGRGIGSRSTVPTLNLEPAAELLPANGVYVSVTHDLATASRWRSITNVGVRPTFGGGPRVVETHLLEPLTATAPQRIEVALLHYVRAERSFPSAERLRAQILADIRRAQRYFGLLQRFGASV